MGKAKAPAAKAAARPEKKVQKIVEDKTFGLKNKNKSKKVQKYVEQVNNQVKGGGNKQSAAFHQQNSDAKKAEKEARKMAELEMFKLLGDAYKPKEKDKTKRTRKKEEEEEAKKKLEEEQRKKEEFERDFAVPIIALKQVFELEAKTEVPRICVVLEHKDNLISKNSNGHDCLLVKISDGTTLKDMTLVLNNETPSTFEKKVGDVLDIRNSIAMLRGDKVLLETVAETTVTTASEALTEHVIKLKTEEEEIRAKGGIPIEQLIEEQRALLDSDKLTPVTKEGFYKWKEEKRLKREKEAEELRLKEERKSGKSVKNMNVLTGRQLFVVDKSLFVDDEDAWDETDKQNSAYNDDNEEENPTNSSRGNTDGVQQNGSTGVEQDIKDKLQIEEENNHELYMDDVEDLEDLDED